MKSVVNKIPEILIYSRLLFAAIIIAISATKPVGYQVILISLLVTGLLTDVFDGIIARKLDISTVKLRRLDSIVDQVFWLSALVATYMLCADFFSQHMFQLILLLSAEVLTYLISYVKFKKEVATHAIFSKIWTLTILATLIEIMASCNSTWLFNICFYTGMVTRAEIIAIILILRKWENDVPSVYHAVLIRKGREIKRNKLFNG